MSIQAVGSLPVSQIAEQAASTGSFLGRAVEWIKDTASTIASFAGKIIKSVASAIGSVLSSIKEFVVEHPKESCLFGGLALIIGFIAKALISKDTSKTPPANNGPQQAPAPQQAAPQMFVVEQPVVDPFGNVVGVQRHLVPAEAIQQQQAAAQQQQLAAMQQAAMMQAQPQMPGMHPAMHQAAMMQAQPQMPGMHPAMHQAAMMHPAMHQAAMMQAQPQMPGMHQAAMMQAQPQMPGMHQAAMMQAQPQMPGMHQAMPEGLHIGMSPEQWIQVFGPHVPYGHFAR